MGTLIGEKALTAAERTARYRAAHPEKIAAYASLHSTDRKAWMKQYMKKWRRKNAARIQQYDEAHKDERAEKRRLAAEVRRRTKALLATGRKRVQRKSAGR